MHLVIISGAARPQSKSNTAKVIAAFQKGYEETGNTAEVWYLSDRRQWNQAAKAFEQNDHILIALPLYVENIPGILLEFLSGLSPKQAPGTKLAFLIQGGFPEASQSRCCEAFLENLPAQLGCAYAGTLIKGDMFGTSLVDEKSRKEMLAPLTEMGRIFAKTGRFEKSAVDAFAGPEYMPEKQIRMYNLVGKHISRFFMGHIAKKLGCKERLDARPYDSAK
ncbi:MAG: NAD(P)H-dependent oxidoreductase [Oscillospiraceae bacterium]|nr:NAD(P)H-dependent oxidoreductase [Oscillospiraceae bacterium]